jgi:hypothetical protein
MRDYGKVHTSFWTSSTTRGMSEDGRALALYLLTSPHSNQIGCFRLPDGYVADDMQWPAERVSEGFAELFRNGFATRDQGSSWVFIHLFLKWNLIENPNQGASAAKLFKMVPDSIPQKRELARALRVFAPKFPVAELNGFETLPEPFRNQEQEQEREQEQEIEEENPISRVLEGDGNAVPLDALNSPSRAKAANIEAAFEEEFWPAYPRKDDKGRARKAFLAVVKAKKATVAELVAGAIRYAAEREGADAKFTKQPATWLNAEAWLNEPPPAAIAANRLPAGQHHSRSQSAMAGILSYGLTQEAPYDDGPVIES